MASPARCYSIGTCEKELDQIHRTLKGISQKIDEKIIESDMNSGDASSEKSKAEVKEESGNEDLNQLLKCEDSEFERRIREMKIVDLEMAVIIFEQQIRIENEIRGANSHTRNVTVYQLRDRLTRCFLKKSLLSKSTRNNSSSDEFKLSQGSCESNWKVTMEASTDKNQDPQNLAGLSITELKVLLTYNGLEFDENAKREILESLVRKNLLQDEDGEDDDWEPPNDDVMNWKSPSFDSSAPKLPMFADDVAETTKQNPDHDLQREEVKMADIAEEIQDKEQLATSSEVVLEKSLDKQEIENPPGKEKPATTTTLSQSTTTTTTNLNPSPSETDNPKSDSLDAVKEESPPTTTTSTMTPSTTNVAETANLNEEIGTNSSVTESGTKLTTAVPVVVLSPSEASSDESVPKDTQCPEKVSDSTNELAAKDCGIPKENPESTSLLSTEISEEKVPVHAKFEEESVVNWNPISLLKDLCQKIAKPEEIHFKKIELKQVDVEKKQKCKLDGYLEKLPVNQTKATMFKGWKRRYFKITQGKLFYFEDHLSTVPLGNILLTGSELKVPGDKTIQIRAQNNGDCISIRCLSSNECNDWYRALKREAVISTPVTAPVQVALQPETPKSSTIIIDLGASTIKAGHVGENKPRVVFPSVYAVRTERKEGGRKFTETGIPDPALCRCGYEALEPEVRQKSKLVFPLRPTLKVDKYAIKSRYLPGFIEKAFKDLEVDPHDTTVIISCQRNFGIREKEILLDFMFGQLSVKAAYIQEQGLLSLYSYKDTTGIIVDVGDHIDVIPVLEGVILQNGASSLPQGGQLVTEFLARILSEGGYRFFSEVESFIVRYVKEQSSFVSLDYEREIESSKNQFIVDLQKYNLPGKQRSVVIEDGRFRCAEGLFDPNKWGKDHEGIHKLVERAIKQTGIDHRKEMCRKIYLSGGTTLIEGFAERLQKELKFLMPETSNIQVHASDNRINAAFAGASVISEQASFSDLVITKDDWHKHGVNILNKSL